MEAIDLIDTMKMPKNLIGAKWYLVYRRLEMLWLAYEDVDVMENKTTLMSPGC